MNTSVQNDQLVWSDESYPIKKFVKKFKLPCLVKLDAHGCGNFGIGTRVDVEQPFLLYATRRCSKMIASSVFWDDSRQKYVDMKQKVIIPWSYEGWFNVNYTGKTIHTYRTIEEVAKRGLPLFITRTPIPCYTLHDSNRTLSFPLYHKDAKPGDIFSVGDIFVEKLTKKPLSGCSRWLNGGKRKAKSKENTYLRCTNAYGDNVLLPYQTQGEFLAVGDPGNINTESLYRLSEIIEKLQLPCLIKLMHGQPPPACISFTGLLKLEEMYTEDAVIACTLNHRCFTLLEFPINDQSKVFFTPSYDRRASLRDSAIPSSAIEYCQKNIEEYVSRMKMVQTFYYDSDDGESLSDLDSVRRTEQTKTDTIACIQSDSTVQVEDELQYHTISSEIPLPNFSNSSSHLTSDKKITKDKSKNGESSILKKYSFSSLDGYVNDNQDSSSKTPYKDKIVDKSESQPVVFRRTYSEMNMPAKPKKQQFRKSYNSDHRLESFLRDSLSMMSKRKSRSSVYENQMMSLEDIVASQSDKCAELNSKSQVDAFLDNIFDTVDKDTEADHHGVVEPGIQDDVACYVTESHASRDTADSHISYETLDNDRVVPPLNIHNSDDSPEAQSSVTSVSSIYRMISGSNDTMVPSRSRAHRTDSGIFVTPRCASPEELGSPVFPTPSPMYDWIPPEDVSLLSVSDVARALQYIGLKPYLVVKFVDEQIDGKQLVDLDAELLKEGFPELNALDRKKVLDFVGGWRPKKYS